MDHYQVPHTLHVETRPNEDKHNRIYTIYTFVYNEFKNKWAGQNILFFIDRNIGRFFSNPAKM